MVGTSLCGSILYYIRPQSVDSWDGGSTDESKKATNPLLQGNKPLYNGRDKRGTTSIFKTGIN